MSLLPSDPQAIPKGGQVKRSRLVVGDTDSRDLTQVTLPVHTSLLHCKLSGMKSIWRLSIPSGIKGL